MTSLLLRMAQQSTMLKIIPMICREESSSSGNVCHHPLPPKKVSFQHLTHHDTSDADAHIPNDVKFVIKEVLDLRFTVLQSKLMSHEVRDGYKTIC